MLNDFRTQWNEESHRVLSVSSSEWALRASLEAAVRVLSGVTSRVQLEPGNTHTEGYEWQCVVSVSAGQRETEPAYRLHYFGKTPRAALMGLFADVTERLSVAGKLTQEALAKFEGPGEK